MEYNSTKTKKDQGYIKITAKKWFQRSYGNTYHSCRVERVSGTGSNYKTELIGYVPFTYGYGDHYLNTAAGIMGMTESYLRHDLRENRSNYAVFVTDVLRKKDL